MKFCKQTTIELFSTKRISRDSNYFTLDEELGRGRGKVACLKNYLLPSGRLKKVLFRFVRRGRRKVEEDTDKENWEQLLKLGFSG